MSLPDADASSDQRVVASGGDGRVAAVILILLYGV
jgi:hypothetical protein